MPPGSKSLQQDRDKIVSRTMKYSFLGFRIPSLNLRPQQKGGPDCIICLYLPQVQQALFQGIGRIIHTQARKSMVEFGLIIGSGVCVGLKPTIALGQIFIIKNIIHAGGLGNEVISTIGSIALRCTRHLFFGNFFNLELGNCLNGARFNHLYPDRRSIWTTFCA